MGGGIIWKKEWKVLKGINLEIKGGKLSLSSVLQGAGIYLLRSMNLLEEATKGKRLSLRESSIYGQEKEYFFTMREKDGDGFQQFNLFLIWLWWNITSSITRPKVKVGPLQKESSELLEKSWFAKIRQEQLILRMRQVASNGEVAIARGLAMEPGWLLSTTTN